MTELVWAHGWMIPTAVILVAVLALAVLLFSEDPREAWRRSEAEDDLRWEKAQRERERREFERKIIGE